MKLSTKVITFTTLLTTLVLTGCQTPSNTLTFTTPSPSSMFDTNNQTALVNVATRDLRPSAEVASYTSSGQITRLNAVPDVAQMFQQAMQQNLNSKGFAVVQGAGNANVTLNIKKFFADVEQGNLRYKINANINVDVAVSGTRGNFNKNFATSRSYEGAFGANNTEIQKVLNNAYSDMIQTIYNDNEIGNAIHQFK
ncbi:hypothetical protein A6B43_06785 [Vespertiliibacter pulmonis]|uniref:Putative lipoprotein n=1 Tax=Vespertiliibacter pulmonis TaxID=1443036 RepID=A0A3N4W7Z0_9PAST|nr:YajG family lipoprotein [Vespertiliibacter pulmonis]QLB21243.1 hypothetical protein A6B43_06785 [Vespertiliibacter pulmonis]RPE85647.1 putative lipoprotein [Vespertiliibacter pulmonis]